jgi:hypothetical protein
MSDTPTTPVTTNVEQAADNAVDYLNGLFDVSSIHQEMQPPTVTTTPEPKQETPPKPEPKTQDDDEIITRMSHLAKRERLLAQKQQQLKALEEHANKYSSLKERAKANPIEALTELGLTIDNIVDYQLNNADPAKAELNAIREEIKAIKEGSQAEKEAAVTAKREAAVNAFKGVIADTAASSEDYALINSSSEGIELVYDACKQYYETTGEQANLLTVMQTVEDYLLEREEKRLSIPKLRNRLMPQQPTTTTPKQEETTTLASSRSAAAATQGEPNTMEDLFTKAVAYLK